MLERIITAKLPSWGSDCITIGPRSIEQDTSIDLPRSAAAITRAWTFAIEDLIECVDGEIILAVDEEQMVIHLITEANKLYASHSGFQKCIQLGKGQDLLEMFMLHWALVYVLRKFPEINLQDVPNKLVGISPN